MIQPSTTVHPLRIKEDTRIEYMKNINHTALVIVTEMKAYFKQLSTQLTIDDYIKYLKYLMEKQSELIYMRYGQFEKFPIIPTPSYDLIVAVFNRLENNNINMIENIIDYEHNDRVIGMMCELNDRFKDKWVLNTRQLEFNSIVPSIMHHHFTKTPENYQFTLNNFPLIYTKMYDMRKALKKLSINDYKPYTKSYINELPLFVKCFLNTTYGILYSKRSYIRCKSNYTLQLSHSTRRVMTIIRSEFPGNVIYIDCDTIYLAHYKDIENRLVTLLDKKYPYLSYDVEVVDIFLQNKKKYTLRDSNGHMKYVGIHPIICE